MQHNQTLILVAVLLIFIVPAAATESITIMSPSDEYTSSGDHSIRVEILTTNRSMSIPYMQISADLGVWEPCSQIDNNRFIKYLDTTSLENENYILSVKTSLEGVEYYDSINLNIDRAEEVQAQEETGEQLSNLSVDSLKEGTIYFNNQSFWILVTDKETGEPIPSPIVSIYQDQSSFMNSFQGTSGGKVKIQWTDSDSNTLSSDQYLVTITKQGYTPLEMFINIKPPPVSTKEADTTEEPEEDKKKEFDINYLDLKIVVGGFSAIEVLDDDSREPLKNVAIKIKDQSTGTVLRTEYTDEFGRASIIWDIIGTHTLGFTYSGYLSDSYTVRVTPPFTNSADIETTTTPEDLALSVEVPRELTPQELDDLKLELVEEIISTHVFGDQGLYSQAELQNIRDNATQEGINSVSQKDIQQPIKASFESYQKYIALGFILLIFGIGYKRYNADAVFRDSVNQLISKVRTGFIKTPAQDPTESNFNDAETAPSKSTWFEDNPPAAEGPTDLELNLPIIEAEDRPTPQPPTEDNKTDPPAAQEEPQQGYAITPEQKVSLLAKSLALISPDDTDKIDSIFTKMSYAINPTADNFADQAITLKVIIEAVEKEINTFDNVYVATRVTSILDDFKNAAIDDITFFLHKNKEGVPTDN